MTMTSITGDIACGWTCIKPFWWILAHRALLMVSFFLIDTIGGRRSEGELWYKYWHPALPFLTPQCLTDCIICALLLWQKSSAEGSNNPTGPWFETRSSEVKWCQIKPSCMSDWPAMLLWGVLKPWGTISSPLSQSGSVFWNRCPFCDPFSPPEPRPAVAGATPLPISHSGDPRARPHPLEFSSTVKGNRVSGCVWFHGHMVDIFHLNRSTAAIPRVVMMGLF